MERAREQLDAFLVRPLRMRRTTARAEIHSPCIPPGILIPVVMRDCGGFDAVSKTVPLRLGPGSLPLPPQSRRAHGSAADARKGRDPSVSRRASGLRGAPASVDKQHSDDGARLLFVLCEHLVMRAKALAEGREAEALDKDERSRHRSGVRLPLARASWRAVEPRTGASPVTRQQWTARRAELMP